MAVQTRSQVAAQQAKAAPAAAASKAKKEAAADKKAAGKKKVAAKKESKKASTLLLEQRMGEKMQSLSDRQNKRMMEQMAALRKQMRSDSDQMRSDLKQMRSHSDRQNKRMTKQMAALQSQIARVSEQGTSLRGSLNWKFDPAHQLRAHRSVFREGDLDPVLGVDSTFTLVRDSEFGLLAIGAAHCSFYHGVATDSKNGRHVAALVPWSIASMLTGKVWFPRGLVQSASFNQVRHDVVLFGIDETKLADYFGPEVKPHSVNLGDLPAPDFSSLPKVLGFSNSINVTGGRPKELPSHKGLPLFEDTYAFPEDQGEPGNSGALMMGLGDEPGDPFVLGTYYGVLRRNNSKPRGVIVPLPRRKSLAQAAAETHDGTTAVQLTASVPANDDGPAKQIQLSLSPSDCGAHVYALTENKNTTQFACVLVKRKPDCPVPLLVGSTVCGAMKASATKLSG